MAIQFAPAATANYLSLAAISVLILGIVAQFLIIKNRKGLNRIPGPFFASFTSLDRLYTALSAHQFRYHIKYHDRYGSLVRVGPKHVSFSNADLIPLVYGITSRFYKSDFYTLFDVRSPQGQIPTVFSIRDQDGHKALKRPVANAYSMSALVELEPMTDDCIRIFQRKLDERLGQNIDLGTWLQWYAFDVITSVTFSDRLGFMEGEKDISNIIEAIEGRLAYNSVIGEVPTLHNYLLGNSFVARIANKTPSLARLNSARYIVVFAQKQLDRYKTKDPAKIDDLRDMLARFKRSRDGEEVMSDADLLSHASSNIFAGSDTTAISLRSMFYYLCKNRRCCNLLLQEIDDLESQHKLSDPVTFAEANQMPYLQACMKEAMRMHPAVGQLLERVVPKGGVTLEGVFLPEGTIVGVNPWVPSRDQSTYGKDAEVFRPERWIEADAERLKLMERNFLAFGSGARTCLGKNVSLLEMSKLVPQMLRDYDIELTYPDREWTLTDNWFVKQSDVYCRLFRRKRLAAR